MELTNSIKTILKQMNPSLMMTEHGIKMITSIVEGVIERIIKISDLLVSEHDIILISDYTIETAYSVITSGNIKQIGNSSAKNTIKQFNNFNNKEFLNIDEITRQNGIIEKMSRPRPRDKSGLTLTVKPIQKFMTDKSVHKIKIEGAIYCTAVIEYIIAELIDVSKKNTLKDNRKKITVDDIQDGISTDSELSHLILNSSPTSRLILGNDNM